MSVRADRFAQKAVSGRSVNPVLDLLSSHGDLFLAACYEWTLRMFKQLALTNFKSFGGQSEPIPLSPVTILVGANGSGKSNVFDAIRFLQGIGRDLSIGEILTGKYEGGRKVFDGLRGGFAEVCWKGQSQFEIGATFQAKLHIPEGGNERFTKIHHKLVCNVEAVPEITIELLERDDKELLRTRDDTVELLGNDGKSLTVPLVRPADVRRNSEMFLPNRGRSTLHRVHWIHSGHDLSDMVVNTADFVTRSYAATRFLEIMPDRMREFASPKVPELGERGENVSAVMHQICADSNRKQQFLEWIAALSAPQLVDIQFFRNDILEVLMQFVEANGLPRTISARSISDGTLRFVGLLAALFSAPEGSVFFMEEIENGLHPTRIHLIIELLEQFAETRKLQVIATTHSSQVLLALSPSTLRDVVLFARTEDTPGTITRRLGDLDHFDEVTQRTEIDRLFTTGWLEQSV